MEEDMFFRLVIAFLNCGIGLFIGMIAMFGFAINTFFFMHGMPLFHALAGFFLSLSILISAEAVLLPQRTIRRPEWLLWATLVGMLIVILRLMFVAQGLMSQGRDTMVMISSIMGICLVWGQLTISCLLRIKFRWNRRNA